MTPFLRPRFPRLSRDWLGLRGRSMQRRGKLAGTPTVGRGKPHAYTRSMRVLRGAAKSPLGHVDNAVMLNARLSAGLRLPQVIALTRSLGRKVSDEPEMFAWRDGGGDEVELTFVDGRCARWQLRRHGAHGGHAGEPRRRGPRLQRVHAGGLPAASN